MASKCCSRNNAVFVSTFRCAFFKVAVKRCHLLLHVQIQIKKNKAFRRFKKLQESRPEFRQMKLEELLPLPLERIQQ